MKILVAEVRSSRSGVSREAERRIARRRLGRGGAAALQQVLEVALAQLANEVAAEVPAAFFRLGCMDDAGKQGLFAALVADDVEVQEGPDLDVFLDGQTDSAGRDIHDLCVV